MMKETPIFYVPGKKKTNLNFYRNYWCRNYDICLSTAAREDLYLDCTQCMYRDNVLDDFSIFVNKEI